MHYLENSELRISILDPIADRVRLGSRYCAGGYIWQAEDSRKGELLAGPLFPARDPSPFHGQGLPEVFEIALGQHDAVVGDEVCVIGVGRVKRESPVPPFHVSKNPTVVDFAPWTVAAAPEEVTMSARQTFREWDLSLTRRVRLQGRDLESKNTVENLGKADLPIRWFAHPFFPIAGIGAFRFSRECAFPAYVPEAGGFRFNPRGQLERNPEYPWQAGCYQLLLLPFGYPVDVYQSHPILGEVKAECRFPVAWMPIWGNDRTLSCEPYFHTVLPPGAKTEWSILYRF
jgi:hypothetical protein